MRKPNLLDVIVLITLLLAACAPQTSTPTAVPTATRTPSYVFTTPEPSDVERSETWNPSSQELITGSNTIVWTFQERVNPLLVVRQTIDDGEYQDMFLISQELATVTVPQYKGRNARLLYQFFDGMQIHDAIQTAKAIGQLKLGSPLAFQMTIRPTGGELDGWWVYPDYFEADGVVWTYQGRELPDYVQKVHVQNWQNESNFEEFWYSNAPGYVKIECGGDMSDTTIVVVKQENRPAKELPICDPVSVDGFYFVNNGRDIVLETDGLLLQILWEVQQLSYFNDRVFWETTWDNVLGFRHIAHAEEVTGTPFIGATSTPIIPWKP